MIETTDFTGTDVTSAVKHGVKKISADEIKLGTYGGAKGSTLSAASDVKVYLVDTDGNIEAITMSDVKTNDSNTAVYTLEEGEITNLFIQEVDDSFSR